MALWYLFLLASIGGIAWTIWAYRKSAAEKADASKARMQELLALAPRIKTPMAAAVAGKPSAHPQPVQAAVYMRKERLLDPAETLLFHRLKSGLPEHEIFAGVSLAAVVDVSATADGSAPDQLRRQLALHRIDFLVCARNSRIVAAVEFEAATEGSKFKSECLATAGIRHVRINPRAIPAKEDVDAVIFGVSPGPNS